MPTVTNKLTKKKTEDVEHYEHLPLAVVNTIVVVVKRRGASVPCLLCHCFLIHVCLHLKSPGFCSKSHDNGVSCAENASRRGQVVQSIKSLVYKRIKMRVIEADSSKPRVLNGPRAPDSRRKSLRRWK